MTNLGKIREIILDTETTGLNFQEGDRIVDIGCVEMINHALTGRTYQVYINPQRKMHPDAVAISGITDEFLADKPLFEEIADDFLEFIENATLVIHNASFDIGFLNSELARLDKPLISMDNVIDTLDIARKKFPGAPVNLDALCKRFKIDTSVRTVHGALVDSQLLAEVYINLLGGKQRDLFSEPANSAVSNLNNSVTTVKTLQFPRRKFAPSAEELELHEKFLFELKNPMWGQEAASEN